MLPNDPKLLELTPFQVVWLIANMNDESARTKKELDGNQESYTVDSNNFDEGTFAALEGLAFNGRRTQS